MLLHLSFNLGFFLFIREVTIANLLEVVALTLGQEVPIVYTIDVGALSSIEQSLVSLVQT